MTAAKQLGKMPLGGFDSFVLEVSQGEETRGLQTGERCLLGSHIGAPS